MQQPKTLVYLVNGSAKKWFPELNSNKYLVITPGSPLLGHMINNKIICFGTVPLAQEWDHFTTKLPASSYFEPIELVVFRIDQKKAFIKYLEGIKND